MPGTAEFLAAIRAADLTPPESIISDGKLHRYASNGKAGDAAGWYVYHDGPIPSGVFGDWRTGLKKSWRADIGRELTPEEEAKDKARIASMRREREAEAAKLHAEAKDTAQEIWQAAPPATDAHPYLIKKGVKSYGLRLFAGTGELIVPMSEGGTLLHSLQFIKPDGDKRFLFGGNVKGCYFPIGKPDGALCIAEGYATGASIHKATKYAVAIVFNAGNLLAVAKSLRAEHPDIKIILCADDDASTPGNPGLTKARQAAQAVGGFLAIPDFGDDRPEKVTDFNDMAALCGLKAVSVRIKAAPKAEEQAEPKAKADKKEGRATQGDRLLEIAKSAEFFQTKDSKVFADVRICNGTDAAHRETWEVASKGFRNWLTRCYYAETGRGVSLDAINSTVNVLQANGLHNTTLNEAHLRTGTSESGKQIYIDLCNKDWQAVEVAASGWKVLAEPPIRFRRAKGALPLPAPLGGGSVDELRGFLNISDDDFVLAIAWQLAALRGYGPPPIAVLTGEHGTTKTTCAKLMQSLIDPSTAPMRSLPKDERDLFISAHNRYVLAYDNVSYISQSMSDALCCMSTGDGYATRTLYSDSEETIFNVKRPVVLNGIEDFVLRPDLADRCLFLQLNPSLTISGARKRNSLRRSRKPGRAYSGDCWTLWPTESADCRRPNFQPFHGWRISRRG